MTTRPFHTVFTLFPDLTHLDFTGPHQFLSRIPQSVTTVASLAGGTIRGDGLAFADTVRMADIEACDLICVPGGLGTTQAANDAAFMAEFRRLAGTATYVTSVCTGSLILGAAGLLKGRRAACHWGWRELLPLYGAIPDAGRVVRDGNVITGGGVTAGIDFALTVLAEVAGAEVAQAVQLGLEYAPEPPFQSGRPETAPPAVLARVQAAMDRVKDKRRAEAEAAARSMPGQASG
ncbi:MAG: DJ-1/PfpI family protein [Hyphomicrobiaceae bacterium]|nr:DJ-1/PfpI family protein [Hyphomicrobiaceae bacterium]